jgi:predicted enzyme related to lactoylglutathione lyase
MNAVALNLLVLRAAEMNRLVDFYSALGLHFERHSHGRGVEHYAAQLGDSVFEIYPRQAESDVTTAVRLGFGVSSVDEAVERLRGKSAQILAEPHDSPWGRRAVVQDPEGHKVEICERQPHPA